MKKFSNLNKLVESLEELGIAITDNYGNMRSFSNVMNDLSEAWNKLAKEKNCFHIYKEIGRSGQKTTDGDIMYWVDYVCEKCGDKKIEIE